MFKLSFENFDFRGFIDFIYGLMDSYGFWGIRFYPDSPQYFTEQQLTHVAPGRDINNPNGFVWVWRKKEGEVRKVSFHFESRDNKNKITMTVNLDQRTISLDSCKGISSVQIEEVLRQNIAIIEEDRPKNRSTKKMIDKLVNGISVGEIHNSQVHFGSGKISEQKNNTNPKQSLLSKYWWGLVVPLAVLLIGTPIATNWSSITKMVNTPTFSQFENSKTVLDKSIFEIIREHEKVEYSTMLERQAAFKKYSGMRTQQETASIAYIQENPEDTNVWALLRASFDDGENSVSIWCVFDSSWQQKLSTIDAEFSINFSGEVKNYSSGIVVLDNCRIE